MYGLGAGAKDDSNRGAAGVAAADCQLPTVRGEGEAARAEVRKLRTQSTPAKLANSHRPLRFSISM